MSHTDPAVRGLQPGALARTLNECRSAFTHTGIFSAVISFLWLTPSIYMLQVYDRVLVSRNDQTLLVLTALIVGVFLLMAWLEWIRSRILISTGHQIDASLSGDVFSSVFVLNLRGIGSSASQALGDLSAMRQFLTGPALIAFFDLPWIFIYLLVIFLMNVWMGWFAFAAMMILGSLTWVNERLTRPTLDDASRVASRSADMANERLRNAEVIHAMGMLHSLIARWGSLHQQSIRLQGTASEKAAIIAAVTKFVRLLTQSLILGLGAFMVLQDAISAGTMIAGSILLGRALSPLEQLLAVTRQSSAARLAYHRLEKLLSEGVAREVQVELPSPRGLIQVQSATVHPPQSSRPTLVNITFQIEPGAILVVLGPSGSGKSSLARMLVGVWPASAGTFRLDGAELAQWDANRLGNHIGYLPQDVDLFEGTVADNIARFSMPDSERVIEAAKAANVHELILRMPDGYETEIGKYSSYRLSGGQQQRIALARALYGDPALVVLDEPNSNLDQPGEQSLVEALAGIRARAGTAIVITHRPNLLKIASHVLVLSEGRVAAFGPPDKVLSSGSVRLFQGNQRSSQTDG